MVSVSVLLFLWGMFVPVMKQTMCLWMMCAQLFGVDVLRPCVAKLESVLMSCSAIVLLSDSHSALETVALFCGGFVGLPPLI